jgi:hypothetical protein
LARKKIHGKEKGTRMKRLFVFILIAALALLTVPIGAVSLTPGIPGITSTVQAETLSVFAIQPTVTEALTAPLDLALVRTTTSARKGSARKGSEEGGEPPVGDPSDTPPPDATPTGNAKKGPNYVAEGKVRRYECMTPCYWDQTRYRNADELGKGTGDIVEFQGPTEIPKDFQFDNWREL